MNIETLISTLILICIIVGWYRYGKKIDLIEEKIELNHDSGITKYEEDLDSVFDFSGVKTIQLYDTDESDDSKDTSHKT